MKETEEPRAAASDGERAGRLLAELVRESLVERRRARRWSIFFRTLTLLLAGVFVFRLLFSADPRDEAGGEGDGEGHTALVSIEGVIAPDAEASLGPIVRALDAAFADAGTRGVVLHVNSPGGSPVQSGAGVRRDRAPAPRLPPGRARARGARGRGGLRRLLRGQWPPTPSTPTRASIVGSIGVRLDGFGAVEAIERLGLERRLLTAGEHKGLLDPFEPVDTVAVARLQTMIDNVHTQFIDVVKSARGERLDDDPLLFTGLVWSGEESVDNGLVDALSDIAAVAREVIGAERVVDFTESADPLSRLRREFGVALSRVLSDTLLEALAGGAGDPLAAGEREGETLRLR